MSEEKFALQTVGDTVVRNNQTNEIYWNYNLVHLINSLSKENEQLKFENETLKSNYQREIQSSIDFCNAYSKINGELLEKIEKLEKENEELKRERDDWKSSTCSYMNKDSLLSMDCQIVQEALWELEKEIEFGSKREDLFFDLKEKFEKLNNHRIGVF